MLCPFWPIFTSLSTLNLRTTSSPLPRPVSGPFRPSWFFVFFHIMCVVVGNFLITDLRFFVFFCQQGLLSSGGGPPLFLLSFLSSFFLSWWTRSLSPIVYSSDFVFYFSFKEKRRGGYRERRDFFKTFVFRFSLCIFRSAGVFLWMPIANPSIYLTIVVCVWPKRWIDALYVCTCVGEREIKNE